MLLGTMQARDITETNKLIYAGAFVVSDMVDMNQIKNRNDRAMVETKIGRASETDAKRPWVHK